MSEFTSYPAGTPSWVDLMPSDPPAAQAFYEDLFGWDVEDSGEEMGHYGMARVRGKAVAGIGGMPQPGVPVAWTTYLATDDVDATCARITEAGGTVMMPPMDVADQGRMAVALDRGGAAFGLWQAGRHHGSEIANEPVSLVWSELLAPDLDAACEFYGNVFGYTYESPPMGGEDGGGGEDMDYRMFKLGDHELGGMTGLPTPEAAPHWGLYFAVADTDAVVAKARDLGATIVNEPTDSPYGRQAMITDPQGATFSIIGYEGDEAATS